MTQSRAETFVDEHPTATYVIILGGTLAIAILPSMLFAKWYGKTLAKSLVKEFSKNGVMSLIAVTKG